MGIGSRELIVVFLLFIYPAPYWIARSRNHPQQVPILVLNLALGWSVIGWVGALIWAVWNFRRDGNPA